MHLFDLPDEILIPIVEHSMSHPRPDSWQSKSNVVHGDHNARLAEVCSRFAACVHTLQKHYLVYLKVKDLPEARETISDQPSVRSGVDFLMLGPNDPCIEELRF